jgi:hypothetical protein
MEICVINVIRQAKNHYSQPSLPAVLRRFCSPNKQTAGLHSYKNVVE